MAIDRRSSQMKKAEQLLKRERDREREMFQWCTLFTFKAQILQLTLSFPQPNACRKAPSSMNFWEYLIGWTLSLNANTPLIRINAISLAKCGVSYCSCGMNFSMPYRVPPDLKSTVPTKISIFLYCKKQIEFCIFSIRVLQKRGKKNSTSIYLWLQWAAVRTYLGEMMAQPQKCSRFICIEHWNGAHPSSTSFPPTIRGNIDGKSTIIIKMSISVNFFVQFYFTYHQMLRLQLGIEWINSYHYFLYLLKSISKPKPISISFTYSWVPRRRQVKESNRTISSFWHRLLMRNVLCAYH